MKKLILILLALIIFCSLASAQYWDDFDEGNNATVRDWTEVDPAEWDIYINHSRANVAGNQDALLYKSFGDQGTFDITIKFNTSGFSDGANGHEPGFCINADANRLHYQANAGYCMAAMVNYVRVYKDGTLLTYITKKGTAKDYYEMRMSYNGTALLTKYWNTSSGEPATWDAENTTASAAGTYFTLIGAGSGAGVRATMYDYVMNYTSGGAPPVLTNFTITAKNNYSASDINNFTVYIENNGVYSTIIGNVTTNITDNSLANITILSNETGGYFNYNIQNYNTSNSLEAHLIPLFHLNYSYANYFTDTNNIARNLNYTLNYTCPDFSTTYILRLINGIVNKTTTATCTNQTFYYIYDNYTHNQEGEYNISLVINTTYLPAYNNISRGLQSFISDLFAPQIYYLNFTVEEGFGTTMLTNVTMACIDNISNNLNYTLVFNSNMLYNYNHTNGTNQTNQTGLNFGSNIAVATCADYFGNYSESLTKTVYLRTLILINERTNSIFDVTNLSVAKVYFDDNRSSFDFIAQNTNQTNFTSTTTDKLRFELGLYSGSSITRYVDVSLGEGNDLRVCANTDDVTHYEQIIISANENPVSLKNVFSNCVIAEDYTRFAYQNSKILKAYTINSLYYLYTFDDGQKVYLASMDGSISTYYNLDVLIFNSQGYNLQIGGDVLTFDKANDILTIFYKNIDNTSVSTTVTITNVNDSSTVFTSTETTDPNEFYMIFDYSTLGYSELDLFKIEVVSTLEDGSTSTVVKYFNTQGQSGIISNGLAFAIALLLTIFGLSFPAVRLALGWFGAIIQLLSIAVLSFAVGGTYITIMMVINVIIAVFIMILLTTQNYSSVA